MGPEAATRPSSYLSRIGQSAASESEARSLPEILPHVKSVAPEPDRSGFRHGPTGTAHAHAGARRERSLPGVPRRAPRDEPGPRRRGRGSPWTESPRLRAGVADRSLRPPLGARPRARHPAARGRGRPRRGRGGRVVPRPRARRAAPEPRRPLGIGARPRSAPRRRTRPGAGCPRSRRPRCRLGRGAGRRHAAAERAARADPPTR